MALPSRYGIDKNMNSMEGLSAYENGGKGSGNFGHSGRPGEIGGSGSGKTQLQRATEAEATSGVVGHFAGLEYVDEIYKEKSKKTKDDLARLKEVKDRDGFVDTNDPAHARLDKLKGQIARAKELVGSDAPEAQQKKIEKLEKLVDEIEDITGWKNSIGRTFNGGKGSGNFGHAGRPGEVGGSGDGGGEYAKRKDYKAEQEGVDARDGYRIGTEFADLERELGNARTNLKMLQKDKETAYTDLAARSRYLDRSSAIARTLAQATSFGKASKETKKLVKEMAKELKDIYDEYVDLGTKKYFDPDLNVER